MYSHVYVHKHKGIIIRSPPSSIHIMHSTCGCYAWADDLSVPFVSNNKLMLCAYMSMPEFAVNVLFRHNYIERGTIEFVICALFFVPPLPNLFLLIGQDSNRRPTMRYGIMFFSLNTPLCIIKAGSVTFITPAH